MRSFGQERIEEQLATELGAKRRELRRACLLAQRAPQMDWVLLQRQPRYRR